jgi:hypothetical protein
MPPMATTVSWVRAMTSSTGAMPGSTLWGGPSQAGGLTATARNALAVGRGGSKKLTAASYARCPAGTRAFSDPSVPNGHFDRIELVELIFRL